MNKRLASFLTSLYPKAWRARYESEFVAFLEEGSAGSKVVVNILAGALGEHLRSWRGRTLSQTQNGLILSTYAWVIAVVAGMNLWWTVDDNPLLAMMDSHAGLLTSWLAIEAGSVVGWISVVLLGLPVLLATTRVFQSIQRRVVFMRLGVFGGAAALPFIWIAGTLAWNGGHWAPLPWVLAVAGGVPTNWPPLPVRWVLCSVTLLLLMLALVVSAVSIRQWIGHPAITRPSRFMKAVSLCLALSCAVMAAGVLGWGLFAQRYAAAIFHVHYGVLNATTYVSWWISLVLFAISAIVAGRGAWWMKSARELS